ncbi:hypothetical protein K7I13_01320 [Brucepastera parasyntrophica]|uniref:hypothetical protein n=1 Tax=Brucepastera parasyntrophica TaxID=2880008 RepID=UPI002108D94D|nr:hypothetical protein [Brucepastera parasyntrophica]ULQ60003.1 hypothetical protein K7I13_01320 [Brucepastera parasyntrophica]
MRVPEGVDYIFYGSLMSKPEGIQLEIVLKGGPYTVTRLISRVYENSNRILLESRLLVRDLFDLSISLPDPEPASQVTPQTAETPPPPDTRELVPVTNIDSLAGSWSGENDVEKIMILRGGRGVVVLSSGYPCPLSLSFQTMNLLCARREPHRPGSL